MKDQALAKCRATGYDNKPELRNANTFGLISPGVALALSLLSSITKSCFTLKGHAMPPSPSSRSVSAKLALSLASLLFSAHPHAGAADAEKNEPPCVAETLSCAQFAQWGLDYPYVRDRPKGSYLYVSGGVYLYAKFDKKLSQSTVHVPGTKTPMSVATLFKLLGEKPPDDDDQRIPVITYGSNAAPWVLSDKFTQLYGHNKDYKGSRIIPVTKAWLKDYDVTWLPHIFGSGGMPATISASPGTEVEVWINWLNADQFRQMNKSEDVGQKNSTYSVNIMPKKNLRAIGYQLNEDVRIYVSCFGAFSANSTQPLAIAQIPVRKRKFPARNAVDAMAEVATAVGFKGSGFEFVASNVLLALNSDGLKERNALLKKRPNIPSPDLELVPGMACQP